MLSVLVAQGHNVPKVHDVRSPVNGSRQGNTSPNLSIHHPCPIVYGSDGIKLNPEVEPYTDADKEMGESQIYMKGLQCFRQVTHHLPIAICVLPIFVVCLRVNSPIGQKERSKVEVKDSTVLRGHRNICLSIRGGHDRGAFFFAGRVTIHT